MSTNNRRRHTPDQIVRKLAEGNKRLAGGQELDGFCRRLEIAESTWLRWLTQYGGMNASDAKRLKEREGENARLKKLLARFGVSQRRPCSVSGIHRSTMRLDPPLISDDEAELRARLRSFSTDRRRRGWRRSAKMARRAGWNVDNKRIHRLWRTGGCACRNGERGGPPVNMGFDNGPEFVPHDVDDWCRFNPLRRHVHRPRVALAERLDRELQRPTPRRTPHSWRFDSLLESSVIIEDFRLATTPNALHTAHGDLSPTEFHLRWNQINQPLAA